MSYYTGDAFRGDYYRGDYYHGDPGLFSYLGKAARGLVSTAVTTATHGLVKIPTFRATQMPPPMVRSMLPASSPFGPTLPGGGSFDGMVPQQPMLPGQRHRALHWNRAGYVTRGGGTSRWPQQLVFHPKGTEPVPSRRMNVGNARALRHALHRVG